MSKRFSALILVILFASFNLFAMQEYASSKDYSDLADVTERKQTYQDALFISPSTALDFKQKLVVLDGSQPKYSLILKKNDQPCITKFLLNGKSVGKLIQVDSEISFKSNDQVPNLSFQIPYQVGSLTINTKGKFLFENKIEVNSAYLTGKEVKFSNTFLCRSGLIVEANSCKTNDRLRCADFLFNGDECNILSKSDLRIHNSLIVIAHSLILNDGLIDCDNESLLQSLLLQNSGLINSPILRFKGNKIVNQGTLKSKDTFYCASKLFDHSGMIDTLHFITEKGKRFSSTGSSVLSVQGDWKSLFTALYLQGSFSVKNINIIGKTFTAESPFHCIADNASLKLEGDMTNQGVIKVLGLLDVDAKNITLNKTSSLMVENADLKVGKDIDNKGTVSVKNHLSIHAHSVSNEGKIETRSSNIKADRYFYNKILSILSGKDNLTINTPLFLNSFGLTHSQSLAINSAMGFNLLGVYAAKNMNINSLLSYNAGLILPKFGSLTEMFSWPSLWGFGESLFIKYAPMYGLIYSALKNSKGLYFQSKGLISEATSLYKQKNIRASEFIAMVCLTKSLINSTWQVFGLGRQSYSAISNARQFKGSPSPKALPDSVSVKNIAKEIGSLAISHYGASVTTAGLINRNWGIELGINNYSNSLYNYNLNTSLCINNMIDIRHGNNIGNLYAYSLILNASKNYSSCGRLGLSSGTIKANNLFLSGPVQIYKDIALEGKNIANIKSDLKARNIVIKSNNDLTISSRIDSSSAYLQSKYINQHGIITAPQVILDGDKIKNFGEIQTSKLFVDHTKIYECGFLEFFSAERDSFTNYGKIQASEQLSVHSGDVNLTLVGQVSTPNAYFKTDIAWKNYGELNANQLVIHSGVSIENRGSLQTTELEMQSEYIKLREASNITAKVAYFKAKADWVNDGTLKGDQCLIDCQNKVINNGTINASQSLQVKGRNIFFGRTSNIKAKDAYYKAEWNVSLDGVTDIERGSIHANGKVITIGKIGASNQLNIDAGSIIIKEKSEISADKSSLKAIHSIQNEGKLTASDLMAHAKHVGNIGTITANNAHIKADRCFWNAGSINVKEQLAIDTFLLMNTFGYIKADSLYTNSIIDLNLLAAYCGNNISKNSFLNLNYGILLPNIKPLNHWKDLFTKDNLRALCQVTGYQLLMQASKIHPLVERAMFCLDTGIKAINCYSRANTLCEKIEKLQNKEDLCFSDIVPSLCEAQNVALSAMQTGDQIYHRGCDLWDDYKKNQEYDAKISETILFDLISQKKTCFDGSSLLCKPKDLLTYRLSADQLWYQGFDLWSHIKQNQNENTEKPYSHENILIPIFSTARSLIASQLLNSVSLFGPQLSTHSLYEENALIFGVNNNSQSLYNTNLIASCFLNNSINTVTGVNYGYLSGNCLSINAVDSYSNNGLLAGGNISITARNLDIMRRANARDNMLLRAHNSMILDAPIKGRNISARAKNILVKKDASIIAHEKSNLIAEQKFTNRGTIDGNKTTVRGSEVVLESGSKILAHGSDGVSDVYATQALDIKEEAKVHSEGKALARSAQQAKVDGSITGKAICVQAKNLDIEENAYLSSKSQTQVIAKQKLTNSGTIDGNQTIMQGNEVILRDASKVLAHGSDAITVINAKKLYLEDGSRIQATTTFVDAQSIQGEEGNTITSSHGTVIKTNHINNKGTINGITKLDFTGDERQLESIGAVDQLTYQGTLDNGIADKLANGHNELLDVAKNGSITMCADEQNVHLKEQHTMPHALTVQTEGAIECDKDLFSENSLLLQARGDIHHASVKSKGLTGLVGKNIYSEGQVTREYNGENYTESCQRNEISGKQVIIQAQENLNYKGTRVHSGIGGTQVYVGGRLISDDIEIQQYNKTSKNESGWYWETDTITEDRITTSVPSLFSSDAVTQIVVGDTTQLHGTIFDSKGGTILNSKFIEEVPTYDTHTHTEKRHEKVILCKDKKIETLSISIEEKPTVFNDEPPSLIISDNPVSLHLNGNSPSITINAPGVEVLVAKQDRQVIHKEDGRYVKLWDRGTLAESHDMKSHPSYSGIINTNAHAIHIEETKGIAATINATHKNACITRSLVEDVYQYQKESLYNRPTPLAINIIVLSLSLAMQSWASSLATSALAKAKIESVIISEITKRTLSGAMNELCLEGLKAVLECDGDCRKAARQFASTKTIRNIAKAAVVAATTTAANKLVDKAVPPLSQANNLGQRILSAAPRELINGGMRCGANIAQGKKPKEAVKQSLRSMAANIIGSAGSSQIGQSYREKKIGFATHKLLHTGLGAVEGAIIDGKRGAIAGAMGAGISETIADVAGPKPPSLESMIHLEAQLGRPLTRDEFAQEWNRQTAQYLKKAYSVGDASKIIATTVAGLANQDMDISYNTATKAVDNNFIAQIIGVAITGASTAYSAYLIHQTYEKEGTEAALKHLGIEIVLNAACVGAFKVGGKLYPSAKAAIHAALDRNPGLKLTLGNVSESLIAGGKKLIKDLEQQAVRVSKHLNPSFAEELVEQVIPGSVLNKVEKNLAQKTAKKATTQLALPAPEKVLLLPKPVVGEVGKETASVLNQGVSLSMKEIAQIRFSEKNNQQDILNTQVEKLFKTVGHGRVGTLLPDDITLMKRAKIEAQAEIFYNRIRSTADDISSISQNTNIPQDIIQRIKNHVFLEDHILKYETGRFGIDADMAAAWQRLIDNKFVKSDLILLQHEYAEARIMNGMEVPYDEAHYLVDTLYNWFNAL